jgi:hypothetical protein
MRSSALAILALVGACGSAAPSPVGPAPVDNHAAIAPLCAYRGTLDDVDVFASGRPVAWVDHAEGRADFQQHDAITTLDLEASDAGWTVRGVAALDGAQPLALRALTELTPGLWQRAGTRPTLVAAEPGGVRIGPTPDALDDEAWRFLAAPITRVECAALALAPAASGDDAFTSAERVALDLGPPPATDPHDDPRTRSLAPDAEVTLHAAPAGAVLAHHRADDTTFVLVVERAQAGGLPWARIALTSAEVIVTGWVRETALGAATIGHGSGTGSGYGVGSGMPRMRCTLDEPLDILVAPAGAPDGDTSALITIGGAAAGASFIARGDDPTLPLLAIVSIESDGLSPRGDWLLRPSRPPTCTRP